MWQRQKAFSTARVHWVASAPNQISLVGSFAEWPHSKRSICHCNYVHLYLVKCESTGSLLETFSAMRSSTQFTSLFFPTFVLWYKSFSLNSYLTVWVQIITLYKIGTFRFNIQRNPLLDIFYLSSTGRHYT